MPNLEKKKQYNKVYRERKKQEEEELKRQIEEQKRLLEKQEEEELNIQIEEHKNYQKRLLDERKKKPEATKAPPQVKHEIEDVVADTKTADMVVDFDEFEKLVDEKAKEKALFFLKNTKKDTEKPTSDGMITGVMKTAVKTSLETVIMMSVPLMLKTGLTYFLRPSIPSNVLQNQNLMNLRNMPLPQQSNVSQQKPENNSELPFGVTF